MQQPVILTIFGITGDLSRSKLIPAIYDLFKNNQLPERFLLIGFGRRDWTQDEFSEFITPLLPDQENLTAFLKHWTYVNGQLDEPSSYRELTHVIQAFETTHDTPVLKCYYYAVAPEFCIPISHALQENNLHQSEDNPQPRILIEKPFGHDSHSAQQLAEQLNAIFEESQIYQIDHYLAKTSAKQIIDFRFYHGTFEKLWNHTFIERIAITLVEDAGIGTRASYYDQSGAIRDMIQSHGLELAALTLMPRPDSATPQAVRLSRQAILKALTASEWTVGQYADYHKEPGVKPDSTTETYATVMFHSDDPMWKNTPITITTGKKLWEKRTEVTVFFKPHQPLKMITFRLYPQPAIVIATETKHTTIPIAESDDGYESVILDAIAGNQTFFVSQYEVIAAWQAIAPTIKDLPTLTPLIYKHASHGPSEI